MPTSQDVWSLMRIIVTIRASVKRCGLWRWPQQPCGAFASSFRAAGRAGGATVTKVAEAMESLACGHDAPGRKDTEGVEATACTWVLPTLPRWPAGSVAGVVSSNGHVGSVCLIEQSSEGRSYRLGCRTTEVAVMGPREPEGDADIRSSATR